MQPEILHRCPSCGAAIRGFDARMLFCPECGKTLEPSQKDKSDAQPAQKAVTDRQVETAEPAAVIAEGRYRSGEAGAKPPTNPDGTRQSTRERTREKLQRASNVARGAIEDNVKRVEKIHHVSTVMFEEAHYDPSLRFVLVAVGIFILFIVLLVLSKVMG